MSIYLFIVIISFIFNSLTIIPFINFLYKIKFQRKNQITKDAFGRRTPIFDKFNQSKAGTPVGGGILIIINTIIIFFLFLGLFYLTKNPIIANYPSVVNEVKILLFTFVAFGFLGLYDDLSKIFLFKKDDFFGLRLRHKFILETVIALTIGFWLFNDLKINIIYVPFFGVLNLSFFYIFFAAFIILAFTNAVNITDGLDGLACGILMFALFGFWVVARSILDLPSSVFIGAWIGGLIAFLYFNIYPARLFLGDAGALSFGATFAVIGLILGKIFVLPIVGGVFVLEIFSSLVQLFGKKYLKRRIFPVAPFHLWLQERGWEEPKIVMRFWIITVLLVIFGLMIALMK